MSSAAYFPFRPRCAHWAAARCQAQAVAHMTNPDGERIPGCWYCWEHGAATLGEYAVKLGEQWGAVQIRVRRPRERALGTPARRTERAVTAETYCAHGNNRRWVCPMCSNELMRKRQKRADRARFAEQLRRIKGDR